MLNEFLSELRQMLPSDRIYTDELRTLGWGTDASFYRQIPKVVIRSDGEEEVSRILALCHKHHLPVTFRAAGTSLSGQSCTDSVLLVAGKHWEKYTLSDDDVITLQPGVVGARVNEILKPHGRVFPPDPASIGSAMVGGIVVNNASGMNCGVHANSDRMMVSAKMVLTDGTVLDTGDEKSRAAFRKSHPEFLKKIEALRDRVRADKDLAERIQKKYSIKNVTGLNLRPLIAYDDPFDIIAHSIVGSEGTLAFLSEVTMKTLKDYPFKASAMVYFMTMKESCEAVVAMKKLKAGDEDFAMSAENLMVKSAEMLDYKSLSSVDDPVFLQYKADVDAGKIEGVELYTCRVYGGPCSLWQILGHPLWHIPQRGWHPSCRHVMPHRRCRLPHRIPPRSNGQITKTYCRSRLRRCLHLWSRFRRQLPLHPQPELCRRTRSGPLR